MNTVQPDQVVIDTPKSARDLFLLAVRGNPDNLATAVSTKPGDNFTLTTNITLVFSRDDVLAMLREGGFEVAFTAANDTGQAQ